MNNKNNKIGRKYLRHTVFAWALGTLVIQCAFATDALTILYHEPVVQAAGLDPVSTLIDGTDVGPLVFDAFGRRFELELQPNPRLAGFPTDHHSAALQGTLTGIPGSWVRLVRTGDEITGIIHDSFDFYAIEPRARMEDKLLDPSISAGSVNIIYRLADTLVASGSLGCETETAGRPVTGKAEAEAVLMEIQTAPMLASHVAGRRISIGMLADYELYQDLGVETEQSIMERLNIVDGIFSEALGIEIAVDNVTVFKTAESDPFRSTNEPDQLLDLVRNYRGARQDSLGLTHLITGRQLAGETSGIAYVGVPNESGACTETGASLTESAFSPFFSALLIAHEIGHNLGAGHDGDLNSSCEFEPATYLMAPTILGNDEFSACSIAKMREFTASANCITQIPYAELRLQRAQESAEDSTITAPLGGEFRLTHVIVNDGNNAATNIDAQFSFPGSMTMSSLTVDGGTCAVSTGECHINSLGAGWTSTVSAVLIAEVPGLSDVTLTIAAAEDHDTANNTRTTGVYVNASPDLRLTIDGSTVMADGTTQKVEILVENNSPNDVTGVRVDLDLMPGASISSVATTDGNCDAEVCMIDSLAGGDQIRINVTLSAQSAGTTILTADSSMNDTDSVPANNGGSLTIKINAAPTVSSTTSSGSGGGGMIQWPMLIILTLIARRKNRRLGVRAN